MLVSLFIAVVVIMLPDSVVSPLILPGNVVSKKGSFSVWYLSIDFFSAKYKTNKVMVKAYFIQRSVP